MNDWTGIDDFENAVADRAQERKRLYGVYPATVQRLNDPDGQGRVRVRLPWSPDNSGAGFEAWARLATFMGGADRGAWFIPERNDEVLVAFEDGDPRRPYVIGSLWNGKDAPPRKIDDSQRNDIREIYTRGKIRITLDDTQGKQTITIETPGKQKIVLEDGPSKVEITDGNNNRVTMEAAGITLSTSKKLSIDASTINISATMITADCPMSKFSGVVKSETDITTTVIGGTYMPGAGNMW